LAVSVLNFEILLKFKFKFKKPKTCSEACPNLSLSVGSPLRADLNWPVGPYDKL